MSIVSFNEHPIPKIKRYITVRDQYAGYHAYTDAPEEVAFLRHKHRHLFKVTVDIEVFHDDRELEFFTVKNMLSSMLTKFILQANAGSCEQQAEEIVNFLLQTYGPERFYCARVSEDGESDGSVTYDPNEQ